MVAKANFYAYSKSLYPVHYCNFKIDINIHKELHRVHGHDRQDPPMGL